MAEISTQAIDAAYQKYLGRTPQAHEYQFWTGNDNYDSGIANSPEAQTYAKGQTYQREYAPMPGFVTEKLNDPAHTTEKYNFARAAQEYGTGDLNALINYYNGKYGTHASVLGSDLVNFGDGIPNDIFKDQEGARQLQWAPRVPGSAAPPPPAAAPGPSAPPPAVPASSGGGGGGNQAASVPQAPSAAGQTFSDPATTQWEQMLRVLIDRLNQPVPELTAAQKELQRTQALDPMTRERDAQKQRVIQQYAAKGHQGPGRSGIVDAALADIDRQFAQMQTTTNANFATADINRADQNFQQNENRAVNAVNLFKQVPQLADSRFAQAQNSLTPTNPYQLLALQNTIQQQAQQQANYGNAQDAAFWNELARLFAGMV